MKWLDKLLALFHSEDKGSDEETIDTLTKKVIELEKENKDQKMAIHTLNEECKRLLDKVDALKKEKMEWSYTSITTDYLPKQEPIRSNKPKRNRNNHRRYYKKDDDRPYVGEVSLIKDTDIPKPGSGDKVEFKNGNPVKRKRKRTGDIKEKDKK